MEHKAQDYSINQSREGNATYTATKALTETRTQMHLKLSL